MGLLSISTSGLHIARRRRVHVHNRAILKVEWLRQIKLLGNLPEAWLVDTLNRVLLAVTFLLILLLLLFRGYFIYHFENIWAFKKENI